MIRFLFLLLLAAAPASATTYVLTVTTAGPKGTSVVTSSNPVTGIWCGSSHTACTATFIAGTAVTLTATTGSTATFAGWSGYADGCDTNRPTCPVVMNAAHGITAKFNPMFALGLHGNGLGVVTSTDGVVNCAWTNSCANGATATYAYVAGSTVILRAVAGSSSTFTGWTGNAGCGTASTCTFQLNGYQTIIATFSSTGPFTIAVNVHGSGTVRSSPAGISCGATCAAQFSSGTAVTLTTTAAAGYFFSGWANGGCSGGNLCVVTSSAVQQGLYGPQSPSAFFYPSR